MTGLTLATLLADPMVQSVLIGLGAIIAHKYFPVLDGFLSKLPGVSNPTVTPAPGSFSATHPVLSAIEARVVALERAFLATPTPVPNAPATNQPPVKQG